jgi:uncharacterized protein GlcG (DUF336 family)
MTDTTTDQTKLVQRSLTETYDPNGETSYAYRSEHFEVLITAVPGTDKHYTAMLLRKLAGWLDATPDPNNDPWRMTPRAQDEAPF